MKKIFAFLPVALLSFALFGCMARLDLNEKMSEAANNQDRLAIIKEFFEKSPMLK